MEKSKVYEDGPEIVELNCGGGVMLKLKRIEPGSFMMGDSVDGPIHEVTFSKPFYMGIYLVTQEQYVAVNRKHKNPSYIGDPSHYSHVSRDEAKRYPVERVIWDEARLFCRTLSKKTGKKLGLPSEAQWEYACRAGMEGDYIGDLDAMAWRQYSSEESSHPVGMKQPNAWGLYDMLGLVWEWCADKWHWDYEGAPTDGSAWSSGGDLLRVRRGGSYETPALHCRPAYRRSIRSDIRSMYLGFRLVMTVS